MSRYRIVLVLYSFLVSISVIAADGKIEPVSDVETVVTGSVRNDAGKPLSSVMVRVSFAEADGPYTITDRNGTYTLSFSSETPEVCLKFSKIGFETETRIIPNTTHHLDIMMAKSAATLREVTVKTTEVHIKGDTISYLLTPFIGKGDVSLKDALKKLPGIEVESSGEIKYNGKKISNFYIEGMDLLGGKYDLATTNLPASYVNAVEVLNNHQDVKIDRRIFNDNVALNIRLKPKAMFRPVGTYSLRAGYGDPPVPLGATAAAMMFRDDFQSILTLKGSDIEEFSSMENKNLYDRPMDRTQDFTAEVLGSLSSYGPPLARRYWIRPVDSAIGLNFIGKPDKDKTIRTNIGYSFLKTEYDYNDSQTYFDGDSDMEIRQFSQPVSRRHSPSFSTEYRLNSDDLYFTNDFSGEASFYSAVLPVETTGGKIRQNQEMHSFSIGDNLELRWKRGKLRWNFTSVIKCTSSPKGMIEISDKNHLMQSGRSCSLLVDESLSGMIEIKRSYIFFPISLSYSNNTLRTALSLSENDITQKEEASESIFSFIDGSRNRIDGSSLRVKFSPEYQYTSRYDRIRVRLACPIGFEYLDIANTGSAPLTNRDIHLLFHPSLYINYRLSAKSIVWLNSSYSRNTGSLLDLLTAPVMTDYLSMSYRSGRLSAQTTLSATLHYDFKLPISLWYVNSELNYLHTRRNLMACQDVGTGLIAVTNRYMPNSTDLIKGAAGITKNLRPINTKISFRGSYERSRNEIIQNDLLINYHADAVNLTGEVLTQPTGYMEMCYSPTFSISTSDYLNRRQSFSSQNHHAHIAFYPVSTLQIKVEADVMRREIMEHIYKTGSLFDAKVEYKFNKYRLSLQLRNILNCRSYSYTVFSGLDRFSYAYSLRGRELIAKIEFTL